MKNINCPITGSADTELIVTYDHSITSDTRLLDSEVENRLSKASGLIFNASGARGEESEFYSDTYELHSESELSEFTYFDQGKQVGMYDNIVEFIESSFNLPKKGRVLDIGCGKGILLNRFAAKYPEWELFAIEPSKNAKLFFSKVMPQLSLFEGNFEDSPYINEQFDLVLSNGVLEHVPQPVDFLQKFRGCLTDNGVGFIGVPNLENNPADMFTFDHLSRFTPGSLEPLFNHVGFSVVNKWVLPTRVPMWYLIEKAEPQELNISPETYRNAEAIAENSLEFINNMFAAYNKCLADAKAQGAKIAMFGTGSIGFLGTKYSDLTFDDIEAIYDDNPTIWGSKRFGITVHNPAEISQHGLKHFIISANPCYLNQIKEKIGKYSNNQATVYMP